MHKEYSRSFIKLRLHHWCHMDYFNNVLTFLGLERVTGVAVYAGSKKTLGFHHKYLNVCSKDERRSYGFGTTWVWVINDRIFIFGWTIPLIPNIHNKTIIHIQSKQNVHSRNPHHLSLQIYPEQWAMYLSLACLNAYIAAVVFFPSVSLFLSLSWLASL